MSTELRTVLDATKLLSEALSKLVHEMGSIPIGTANHFPYGWRKAAKGRTVWRLIEEAISQNLELKSERIGLKSFSPASSEVGVYDFSYKYDKERTVFVNIKSAVQGARTNKDDISKAAALKAFLEQNPNAILLVASIEISFSENPMNVSLENCYVVPITWLPDIYVNPSNNGNLQSSKYKDISGATQRTNAQFLIELVAGIEVANEKKRKKRNAS